MQIISICSVSLLAAENVADLNARFAIGVVQVTTTLSTRSAAGETVHMAG